MFGNLVHFWKLTFVQSVSKLGMEEQRPDMNKTNSLLKQQEKKENICYDTFSTDIDESV